MNPAHPASSAPPTQAQQTQAYALGMVSVAAFALTLPGAKVLAGHLGALQIGVFRSLLAAVAALGVLWWMRARWPSRAQAVRLLAMSVGVVYGFPILTALGMQHVPVGHGGVVLAALPLATAVCGAWLTRERLPALFWLASVAGFVLVALFAAWRNGAAGMGGFHVGDVALLGAVVLAGYGYAQGGALAKEMPGWAVMCWALALNVPVLLALSVWLWDAATWTGLGGMGAVQWGALAFLAWVNSLLGFFTWNRALALGGIARISQLQLLQPFLTYGYSLALMGEAFDPWALAVCAAVMALVLLSKRALAGR